MDEIVNVLVLGLVSFVIFAVGGGLAYLIWMKTRAVRLSWTARCYQKGDGIRGMRSDLEGNKLASVLRLQDLKPYYQDTLQRIEMRSGTVYKLVKLDKTTNAVTADMVEVWDKDKKYVDVLIDGDTATLMKKGYDATTGNIIFQPMPRERLELVKSEIIIKKERYQRQKDLWASVIPWVVIGVAFFSLVGTAYFTGDALVKIGKMSDSVHKRAADLQEDALKLQLNQTRTDLGATPKVPDPPSIE